MHRMSRCTVLLKNIWPFGRYSFHPHSFTTSIRTRNDCLKSSEINAWTLLIAGVLAVHSFEWLFLAGILEPSLDCSKAVYFATTLINVDLEYQKNQIIFITERPTRRLIGDSFENRGSSIILRTLFQHRGHFENTTLIKKFLELSSGDVLSQLIWVLFFWLGCHIYHWHSHQILS